MPETKKPDPLVTLRILWAALFFGQVAFLVASLVLAPLQSASKQNAMLIPMAFVMAVLCSGITMALPLLWSRSATGGAITTEEFVSRRILRMAIVEGSALFAIVVFLLTGQKLVLAALAIAFATFAVLFPQAAERE
jgi:hypothetical protein